MCQPFLLQGSTDAAYKLSDFPYFADKPHKLFSDSVLSYYFGRIPFPLKQKHPLNYTIRIFCFSPDCTKRLFFGSGKQKRAIEQPFSLFIIFPLSFYCFSHTQTRKLLYFYAKLGYYHRNCRLLPDSIIPPQSPSYQRHQKRKKERPANPLR